MQAFNSSLIGAMLMIGDAQMKKSCKGRSEFYTNISKKLSPNQIHKENSQPKSETKPTNQQATKGTVIVPYINRMSGKFAESGTN
jgi:hypothetical protein